MSDILIYDLNRKLFSFKNNCHRSFKLSVPDLAYVFFYLTNVYFCCFHVNDSLMMLCTKVFLFCTNQLYILNLELVDYCIGRAKTDNKADVNIRKRVSIDKEEIKTLWSGPSTRHIN